MSLFGLIRYLVNILQPTNPASIPDKQEMYDNVKIRERDFPLLREMNANVVRTWGEVLSKTWLDDLYNDGVDPIYVLMGFWINCNENYGDPVIRQAYIDGFTAYVNEYKDHPAVLAWGIGNENNYGFCTPNAAYLDDLYVLANDLAKIAYEIEGENYHPAGFVNGDLLNIGTKIYNSTDEATSYLDFWGSNVYPGKTFGTWFDVYASLSGKPLFITEYGIDALNNTDKTEHEDAQSEWVVRQWKEMDNADMVIGSTLMAYSDEWWKQGGLTSHDPGGYPTDRHPDGYSNEEWWGVMRTIDDGVNIDILEPREVYYALQSAWGGNITFNIPLDEGWNLISFPVELVDKSLGNYLSSIDGNYDAVYTYDGNKYLKLISTSIIDLDKGYWIKMDVADTVEITGLKSFAQPEIDENWNLVSYTDMNNQSIFAYNNGVWSSFVPGKEVNTLVGLVEGKGYWMKK